MRVVVRVDATRAANVSAVPARHLPPRDHTSTAPADLFARRAAECSSEPRQRGAEVYACRGLRSPTLPRALRGQRYLCSATPPGIGRRRLPHPQSSGGADLLVWAGLARAQDAQSEVPLGEEDEELAVDGLVDVGCSGVRQQRFIVDFSARPARRLGPLQHLPSTCNACSRATVRRARGLVAATAAGSTSSSPWQQRPAPAPRICAQRSRQHSSRLPSLRASRLRTALRCLRKLTLVSAAGRCGGGVVGGPKPALGGGHSPRVPGGAAGQPLQPPALPPVSKARKGETIPNIACARTWPVSGGGQAVWGGAGGGRSRGAGWGAPHTAHLLPYFFVQRPGERRGKQGQKSRRLSRARGAG